MQNRNAELIKVIEPKEGLPWYFTEYVYRCCRCGATYTRYQHGPHISPYCHVCNKERLKYQKMLRQRAAEKKAMNDLLEMIKQNVNYVIDTYKLK